MFTEVTIHSCLLPVTEQDIVYSQTRFLFLKGPRQDISGFPSDLGTCTSIEKHQAVLLRPSDHKFDYLCSPRWPKKFLLIYV